jgi:hypothetical protein
MAAKVYHEDLLTRQVGALALPYELVTGRSSKTASKRAMIAALEKHFDARTAGCHAEYLGTAPTPRKEAVDAYRGFGFDFMNIALRTGRMKFDLNGWSLSMTLGSKDISTVPSDVRAFARSEGAFVDTLYERTGLENILKEYLRNSAATSVARWELLANMIAVVSDAPPRAHDVTLWRGERMWDAFDRPEGRLAKSIWAHSQKMTALKPGDTFVRADFSSFSMSPVVASNFAGSTCCVYKLRLPKDTPALFMESFTSPREFEVILPPKTRFRVIARTRLASSVASGHGMTLFELAVDPSKK